MSYPITAEKKNDTIKRLLVLIWQKKKNNNSI